MNNCIKTGARVRITNYNITVPADLFEVGDCVVVNMNPGVFEYGHELSLEATHEVMCVKGFLHKDKGVCVIPKELIRETTKATGSE